MPELAERKGKMKTDFEQETAEEAELQALIRKIGPADRVSMGEAAARWKTVGKPLFSLESWRMQ